MRKAPHARAEQKGRAMHEARSTLNYSFGEIATKCAVDGKVNQPGQVADHMLSTAATVLSIETVQQGLSGNLQDRESASNQKCVGTVEFGNISASIEIDFKLKRQVSNRVLNSIVFGDILPKVWETAGIYLGDNQPYTTPATPLPQQLRRQMLSRIDELALGVAPTRQEAHEPANESRSQLAVH